MLLNHQIKILCASPANILSFTIPFYYFLCATLRMQSNYYQIARFAHQH